ncbi:MAG: outer-membrane lipoprotein carrier protein LolA [Caloramator sp.]|nr:outer-membrane lipoprotein carrier protein LolA [Caloramator sp.]
MLYKKTILVLVIIFAAFISCSRKIAYEDVKKRLEEMKSYTTQADIDIYGNKGVSHYKVVQYYKEPNLIRIETNAPSFLKGKILIYDGKKYSIYHPIIEQKYFLENLKDDDVFIFLGVIDKRIFLKENSSFSSKRVDGKDYFVIKSELDESSAYRKYVEIYFNSVNLMPEIMTFYDEKENVRVNIIYKEFKYNPTIQEGLFKIQ